MKHYYFIVDTGGNFRHSKQGTFLYRSLEQAKRFAHRKWHTDKEYLLHVVFENGQFKVEGTEEL